MDIPNIYITPLSSSQRLITAPPLSHIQGVPRNMTVGEYFKMSSSIIFYYSQIDYRLRYIRVKDFSNELNCKKSLNLIKYLEDDILNYSSTVMFRGTPCSLCKHTKGHLKKPPPSIRRHDKMSQSIFKSNVSKKLYLLKECNDVENLYKPIKNSIISTSYIILIILAEIY